MIEADSYIRSGSPFERHFVPETSDPATYVGCHYVDQFGWFTGLRPQAGRRQRGAGPVRVGDPVLFLGGHATDV